MLWGVRGLALVVCRLPALKAGRRVPLPLLGTGTCGRQGPAPSLCCAGPAGGCVPRRWWGADPWGVAFPRCEGRLMSGAVPLLAARLWGWAATTRCPCVRCTGGVGMGEPAPALAAPPQGGLSGSATHLLWARVCRRAGPAPSLSRGCPAGGCVPPGWGGTDPWGVAFHRCEGRLVSGAVSLRPAVPRGGRPGPVARVSRSRVVLAWGTQHRPHSVRSCKPALRVVGVAGGRPRGGCLVPL